MLCIYQHIEFPFNTRCNIQSSLNKGKGKHFFDTQNILDIILNNIIMFKIKKIN